MRPQRRVRFYLAAAAVVAIGALGLQAFWLEPASLRVVEERADLPLVESGTLRVAILTDLHVGSPFNGLANLRRIVDVTNASKPDLVFILGDLVVQGVRGGTFVPPEQIGIELNRLRASTGVFGVLGNHDGWLDHDRVARTLVQNGVRLVEDRSERIQTAAGPLWIAGVSDWWIGKHDVAAAVAGIKDDGTPAILLSHNPDVFPLVPARISLTLAGHTHGGQVRFPIIGAPIIPSQYGRRFAVGHVIEDGRHLFVATGIGTSILPVRFRVPPSVTLLTLH